MRAMNAKTYPEAGYSVEEKKTLATLRLTETGQGAVVSRKCSQERHFYNTMSIISLEVLCIKETAKRKGTCLIWGSHVGLA